MTVAVIHKDYCKVTIEKMKDGRYIPFFGCQMYPLGFRTLAEALKEVTRN